MIHSRQYSFHRVYIYIFRRASFSRYAEKKCSRFLSRVRKREKRRRMMKRLHRAASEQNGPRGEKARKSPREPRRNRCLGGDIVNRRRRYRRRTAKNKVTSSLTERVRGESASERGEEHLRHWLTQFAVLDNRLPSSIRIARQRNRGDRIERRSYIASYASSSAHPTGAQRCPPCVAHRFVEYPRVFSTLLGSSPAAGEEEEETSSSTSASSTTNREEIPDG